MKKTDESTRVHRTEEITTMSHNDRNSTIGNAAKAHLNSGIVVFSSMRKPLYVNEAARRALIRLNRSDNGRPTRGTLPSSVDALLDEMVPLLATPGVDRGWRQLETRRLTAAPDQAVLVKTIGIPDRVDIQRSLIILTIEEAAQAA